MVWHACFCLLSHTQFKQSPPPCRRPYSRTCNYSTTLHVNHHVFTRVHMCTQPPTQSPHLWKMPFLCMWSSAFMSWYM